MIKQILFALPLLILHFPVSAATLDAKNIMSIAMSLGLVIATIIILAILIKKFNPQLTNLDEFKVIRSIPLGTKERLMVVEIDDKQHLLGVTPHSINYLYQLEQPLSEKEMPKLAQSFSQFLNNKNVNSTNKNNTDV